MQYKAPSRVQRLGTETAYAVALEAASIKAEGKKLYPFHIGDLNFPVPPVAVEAMKEALDAGATGYCPAAGITDLRRAIAERVGEDRDVGRDFYGVENVSIQPGGKPTIGKFLLTVMEQGDEILYPSPGYPIYESLINYLGGVPKPYGYIDTGNDFAIDIVALRNSISSKSRALIFCNPSNPLATLSSEQELEDIAAFCRDNDLWVLSDEPYFDIVYSDTPDKSDIPHRSLIHLPGMKDRTIILYTFSKNYSMTGIRLGAAVGPEDVITHFNKLNTNFEACTCHFVQYGGLKCLTERSQTDASLEKMIEELRKRRDLLVKEIETIPGMSCHRPRSTFYLPVNVTEAMQFCDCETLEQFRRLVLKRTGVSFCTRDHFGSAQPYDTDHYIRLAYSGVDCDTIHQAMASLRAFLDECSYCRSSAQAA